METSWTDILKIVSGVLGSIGIGGAIVAGLSSWLGKVWANRLMAEEKAKYEKELERLVKQLERKNYVSKVRFDAEFAIYQDLCKSTDEMERAIYMLFPSGVDHLPPQEDLQKQIFAERYKKACSAYHAADQSLSQNGSFISKDMYELFYKINDLCRIQINLYPYSLRSGSSALDAKQDRECWERTLEIDKEYKILQEKLREYLKTLDVVDEK